MKHNLGLLPAGVAGQGLRPSLHQIVALVDEFFWRVRPRGKPPVSRNFGK